jgi:hypothetical protein
MEMDAQPDTSTATQGQPSNTGRLDRPTKFPLLIPQR